MDERPPWSQRRRRALLALALGGVAGGLGTIALPNEYGITSAFLGALCAFLLVAATIVFVAIPGPDTLGTLSRSSVLAGAVLVVAVLLWLSTTGELRWIWLTASGTAAAWTAYAVRQTRGPDG